MQCCILHREMIDKASPAGRSLQKVVDKALNAKLSKMFVVTAQKFGVYCRKKCTWVFWLDINFLTLVLQKYIDIKIF